MDHWYGQNACLYMENFFQVSSENFTALWDTLININDMSGKTKKKEKEKSKQDYTLFLGLWYYKPIKVYIKNPKPSNSINS